MILFCFCEDDIYCWCSLFRKVRGHERSGWGAGLSVQGFHHKNLVGRLMSDSAFHHFKVYKMTARNVWWLVVESVLSPGSAFVFFIASLRQLNLIQGRGTILGVSSNSLRQFFFYLKYSNFGWLLKNFFSIKFYIFIDQQNLLTKYYCNFCRTVIDGIVLSVRKVRPEEAESWERPRRIIETFLWFVGALLLAAVIPDIGSAINMISGLAAMFIFVFPGEYKFLQKT